MFTIPKIKWKSVAGFLLAIFFIIFMTAVVQDEVKATAFFASVYIAAFVRIVISKILRRRAEKEQEVLSEWGLLKFHVKRLFKERKISGELLLRILLPLSLFATFVSTIDQGDVGVEFVILCVVMTIVMFGIALLRRVFRKYKARKLERAGEIGNAGSKKAGLWSRSSRPKITMKLVVIVYFALAFLSMLIAEDAEVVAIVFSIGGMILCVGYLVIDRFVQKAKVSQLKESSMGAEIHMLKSQINPHFFFNTLNNLYGLVVEKSDKAPEVVLKLSDMMRYTIYEGEKDSVALSDEVKYLENYLELQRIRFQRELDIKFDHPADEQLMIPPLLFIVLVENAFKHGAETMTENAFIHIKLLSIDNALYFETHNNFKIDEEKESGGIGLKNLQRRLELLFPEKHSLVLDDSAEGEYKATLKFTVS